MSSPNKQQNAFTFIFMSGRDEDSASNKQRVRSNAATKGWDGRLSSSRAVSRRGSVRSQEDKSASPPNSELVSLPEVVPAIMQDKPVLGPKKRVSASTTRPRKKTTVYPTTAHHEHEESTVVCKRTQPGQLPNQANQKKLVYGRICDDAFLASLQPVASLSGNTDPFHKYPVPCQPWFAEILHYHFTEVTPRGWSALGFGYEEGRVSNIYAAGLMLKDPASFYTMLYVASGEPYMKKQFSLVTRLWIRGQAIRAINQALGDPSRALSDPLILAMGIFFIHEIFYEDPVTAVEFHLRAHRRMIHSIGGIENWKAPKVLKETFIWFESVVGALALTPRHEWRGKLQSGTLGTFSKEQSAAALARWYPYHASFLADAFKEETEPENSETSSVG